MALSASQEVPPDTDAPFGVEDPPALRGSLVLAARELRWLSRSWLVLAVLVAVAAIVSGSVASLSPLEVWAVILLLWFPVFGALAGRLLGLRTPPEMLYGRIFDRSRPPPPQARLEPEGRTASRAGWAAIAIGLALAVGAVVAVAAALLVMGKAHDEIGNHLAGASALVSAGWLLVCSLTASRIATWFERWQRRHGRVVLCSALSSGRMDHVYFAGFPQAPTSAAGDGS